MEDTKNRLKNLEWLKTQPVEYQLSLFQDYAEIMRIIANNLMQEEMTKRCGERYSREKPNGGRYSRWGYNPGSIKVGSEKIPIEVPRYSDKETKQKENVEIYDKIK
ncbi:MAG: hypothetical protein WHS65_07845, partial [Melioribacteraceae bacterium]